MDLEKSPIEKNVFVHFQSNDPAVKKILDRLERETRAHVKKVQALMEKI